MGKISRYLTAATILGVAIVGFWIYQKYFKASDSPQVVVTVERGNLEELIRAQGEVSSTNEYNLEFATAGIVRNVYVKEGDQVAAGAPLMKLDTSELALEQERLSSLVAQRVADLSKLTEGATPADIAVYEAKVASAASALQEAQKAEQLALRAVFTATDDAVRGTTDLFYTNTTSATPQLSFTVPDFSLKNSLEAERAMLTTVLNSDSVLVSGASTSTLHAAAVQMQSDAQRVGVFLDNNAKALNTALSGSISATTIQTWQSAVATARSALNTNARALATADEARSGAEAALSVAQKELTLRKSPARQTDIDAAKAAISEAQSQVKIVDDKIRKATLTAPEKSRVVHTEYKVGETSRLGVSAVVLNDLLPKVESDVSELDIARVYEGAPARITFDALPGETYTGTVATIDPRKIEKDTDTYYRVNFTLASSSPAIRAGMTAEVLIRVSKKNNVLTVPAYAAYERDGAAYAQVEREGGVQEVPIVLGITDGQLREIVSGLLEGERVVVPID